MSERSQERRINNDDDEDMKVDSHIVYTPQLNKISSNHVHVSSILILTYLGVRSLKNEFGKWNRARTR